MNGTFESSESITAERKVLKRPSLWSCMFYNDDYTPMALVVDILVHIFNQSNLNAEAIMLRIHKEGKVGVGSYPKEIAYHKSDRAIEIARSKGFPLQVVPTEIPTI